MQPKNRWKYVTSFVSRRFRLSSLMDENNMLFDTYFSLEAVFILVPISLRMMYPDVPFSKTRSLSTGRPGCVF